MYADCHIHMVLDGVYYKDAIAAHRQGPREDLIRPRLEAYRSLGSVSYTHLTVISPSVNWATLQNWGSRGRMLSGGDGI